jgi:hypothetical protein
MGIIPFKQSGTSFSHDEANQPFAIENAVVSGGDLVFTIGDGRAAWGNTRFDLDTSGVGTSLTEASIPASADDYYVVVSYAGGTPAILVTTTTPAASTNSDHTYVGFATVNSVPSVTSFTDIRGFLIPSSPRTLNGDVFAVDPFRVVSAAYDAGDEEIDLVIGPGRTNFSGGVTVNFSVNTTKAGAVAAPTVDTAYYVGLNSSEAIEAFSTPADVQRAGLILLAKIDVGNPASVLTITDLRTMIDPGTDDLSADGTTPMVGALYEGVNTADTTTSYALDWSAAPIHSLTLTGSCVFTFSNVPPAGGAITVVLKQDATGSRTATWPASVKWAGGAPVITSAANSVDVVSFVTVNGGTIIYGFVGGQGFA